MKHKQLEQLFEGYVNGTITEPELTVLYRLLADPDLQEKKEELINKLYDSGASTQSLPADRANAVYSEILRQSGQKTGAIVKTGINWKKWAAAAAVLLFLSAGAYLLISRGKQKQEIAKKPDQPIKQDVLPGGNKAVLTLGDGSTIILDSAANGKLASQGGTSITKLDGQLAYNGQALGTEVLYNTITTPRGGQYQLTLADGTKVWLNAASSLRYPATFTGKERKVELTGEGYFEVAKNASMPFKVNVARKGEVEVLGTHFNINAYSDESTINTTLLEGLVKVSTTGSGLGAPGSRLLSPGQQAQLNPNGDISINRNVNTDEVIAWKNGKFSYESSDLKTILRQFARWYDIEVVYERPVGDEKYFCIMDRSSSLSNVLKSLQANAVQFKIEGKKLYIR